MEPSKKAQLLCKIFLRGYKPPSLAPSGNPVLRSNSYSFTKSTNEDLSEQRYKRRQRNPEDYEEILPPPVPFGPSTIELVELNPSPPITKEEMTTTSTTRSDMEDGILSVSWNCDTLDKRRDIITDYFQRAILKQRRDYDVAGAQAAVGDKLYEDVPSGEPVVMTSSHHHANNVSSEPIYAEIYSDKELEAGRLVDLGIVSEPNSATPSEDAEHLYENIDIIRHEMLLRRASVAGVAPKTTSASSVASDTSDESQDSSGEIDEESIIENKPAIKSYWETKMKESAASQFARSNFGTPTIIDKINEEIRDDYMRNLELMHDEGLPRSSASDTSEEPIEFDSFDMASSSNGGSPFGQPNDASSPIMSESPTPTDSGHQSQQSHSLIDHENDPSELESLTNQKIGKASPLLQDARDGNTLQNKHEDKSGQNAVQAQRNVTPGSRNGTPINRHTVETNRNNVQDQGKLDNHVTHYTQFNKKWPKTVKPFKDITPDRETSPADMQSTDLDHVPERKNSADTLRASKSDLSYVIATARLKKEIEDNLKRERELKEQGRVKTLSVETVTPVSVRSQLSPETLTAEPAPAESKPEEKQEDNQVNVQPGQKQASPPPVILTQNRTKVTEVFKQPTPPPVAQKPAALKITARTPTQIKSLDDSTKKQEYFTSKQAQQEQAKSPNFKIGKNFNSLERYIMYSSLTKLNFRSIPPVWTNGAATSSPTETSPATDDEPQTPKGVETPSANPTVEEATMEEIPTEKVRKNYIPTQKRIENELLEMMQREEELKRSRQHWKSTPNLNDLKDDDSHGLVEQRHEVRRETEKRRRSALISKWEDLISKNSQ